ncbi:ABC transporter permease [Microbulbifer hydrolyticus]|uniref:ABC transporter permease n=1 Tax=Microbulbifer hydrolyticus TaxID=48074 RepID=A0A6P1TCG9_9GAMM|nr:ABC transporter permease [Microbulbifer hydrolyticus]MBB5210595.1 lipopolysaccharide transport system permease protein [Microbulbifer hydrolyticus]QHQ38939.1 ABC transporter permease [Microbulbifer hydrolyticus]
MIKTLHTAFADVRAAIKLKNVWVALASEDISDQHKRTSLGPLWLLLNYLAFAFTFIVIFERGQGIPNFQSYVSLGLLVWFFVSEIISLSVTLFAREEGFLKGTTLPLSTYAFRLMMQSTIRLGFTTVGCVAILAITGASLSIGWLYSAVGIALLLLIAPAIIICMAFLGAFFPDSQFIVSNAMRIGMFLTPIFWHPANSGGLRQTLYDLNPFTYALEIVRQPIITGEFQLFPFTFCASVGLVLWLFALLLLGALRKKVIHVL